MKWYKNPKNAKTKNPKTNRRKDKKRLTTTTSKASTTAAADSFAGAF